MPIYWFIFEIKNKNMFFQLDPEIGYRAIPALTQQYLAAINEILSKGKEEHLNSPFTDKCFEDPDFQEDWHICSSWVSANV